VEPVNVVIKADPALLAAIDKLTATFGDGGMTAEQVAAAKARLEAHDQQLQGIDGTAPPA